MKSAKSPLLHLAPAIALAMIFGLAAPARAEESVSSKVLTLVSKMSAEQQEALYNLLTKLNADGAKAAAAPSAAPAPEKALADNIKKVKEAAIKGDLDAVMSLIADDFQQSQLGGRDALKLFLSGILASGEVAQYAKDTEISSTGAKITNENGKATIDPITVTGPWGSASLSFTAKLVGSEWKITGAELH